MGPILSPLFLVFSNICSSNRVKRRGGSQFPVDDWAISICSDSKAADLDRETSTMQAKATTHIELWPIDKLIYYARNPRKNDAAVDRMVASIREFGFKIPVLARSNGEVVDGHMRLK